MSNRRPPDVIDGLRTPDLPPRNEGGTARDQARQRATGGLPSVPPKAKKAAEAVAPKAGVHRFISHIANLLVTKRITLPKTAADGTLIPEVHEFAQFRGGYYETADPEMAAFLRGWKTFGLDYFDADQVSQEAQEKADAEWLEAVAARPDLQDKLRVMLGATDFDLEDAEPGGGAGEGQGGGAPGA